MMDIRDVKRQIAIQMAKHTSKLTQEELTEFFYRFLAFFDGTQLVALWSAIVLVGGEPEREEPVHRCAYITQDGERCEKIADVSCELDECAPETHYCAFHFSIVHDPDGDWETEANHFKNYLRHNQEIARLKEKVNAS